MSSITELIPGDPAGLGGYELRGRLGEGGQGVVYLGADERGDPVAVKWLRPHLAGDEVAAERFAREAVAAQRVAPFCTAKVLATGVHEARPYIVSEYVEGPTLQEAVALEGPRTGSALYRLAIGTATALAAVHRAGIVHRDLSPANVVLGAEGPRVIDFGIARALDATSTITSTPVGTPAYMAPEQILDQPVGPPADMFAWGSVMVFAGGGTAPFEAESVPLTIQKVLYGEPDLSPLTGSLRELVAACLDKDPLRRPAAEQVIRRLLEHPTSNPAELGQAAAFLDAPGPPHGSSGPHLASGPHPGSGPYPASGSRFAPGPGSASGPQAGPSGPSAPALQPGADPPAAPSWHAAAGPGTPPNAPLPPGAGPSPNAPLPPGAGPYAGPAVHRNPGPFGGPTGSGDPAPYSAGSGPYAAGSALYGAGSGPGGSAPYGRGPGSHISGSGPYASHDPAPPPTGGPSNRRGVWIAVAAAVTAMTATVATIAVAVGSIRDDSESRRRTAATSSPRTPAPSPVPTTDLATSRPPDTTGTLYESPADPVRLTTYKLRAPKTKTWIYYARDSLTGNFTKHPGHLESLLSPDGRYLAKRGKRFVNGYDSVEIVDKVTGEAFTVRTSQQPLSAYVQAWSRDGERLLLNVGTLAKDVWQSTGFAIVDVATRQAGVASLREGSLKGIRYGFDHLDSGVVAMSNDTTQQALRFFDPDGRRVRHIPNVGAAVAESLFSPSGKRFVTNCPGLGHGTNCVYDALTGAEVKRFSSSCASLATWYDDDHVVCWTWVGPGARNQLQVRDLTGAPVRVLLDMPSNAENMDVVYTYTRP